MSFFRKLFGGGKSDNPPPPPADPVAPVSSKVPNLEPIRVFDKFGREMLIPRHEWLHNVLLGNLKKEWSNPDALASLLIQSLQDGFDSEVEEAARQLYQIDPQPARGATLLGLVFLQTGRPAAAEKLFLDHVGKHGGDGVLLTNLAKAQSALGRGDESLATLWNALELDPNQDNGLGWYEVIHREKNGPEAGQEALRRVSAVPGSWRAQLWLARHALQAGDLAAAQELYRQSLAAAGDPVPTDLLVQMSGDLGNHAHLPELIELTAPRFDIERHGLQVGNNLLKACLDTGQIDTARGILRQLQACQRPDWRQTLGFWEGELLKVRTSIQEPLAPDQLEMSLLTVSGPLWIKEDHPIAKLLPQPAADAARVVFMGSSFEAASMPSLVTAQPSDNPGRMSRAIPLFLNEQLYLRTDAMTLTLQPWITNQGGGFALFGTAPDPADFSHHARQVSGSGPPADFLVLSHLIIRGENWRLKTDVVRTIDASVLKSSSYDFAEAGFGQVAERVVDDLLAVLSDEGGLTRRQTAAGFVIGKGELDHYLFRLEQALAVRCTGLKEAGENFLSNPAEILDGMIHLCLQNPAHLPSRMLLWRTLAGLRSSEPELVKSIRPKVEALMEAHPLEGPVQAPLEKALQEVCAA